MKQVHKAGETPVISVINMKGGVGKTTISAHLFRYMVRCLSKSILLVDFDPQFNLTQTLMNQKDYEAFKNNNKTIFSVMEPPSSPSLFNIAKHMGPPPNVDDLKKQIVYWAKTGKTALGLIPGDFKMTKYTLVDDPRTLDPVKKRFVEFIEKAKSEYDLVVLDCNPSSSFMSLCALTVSSHLLIPVKADRYSLLGLEMLDEFVTALPTIVNKPKKIILVNGGGQKSGYSSFENNLRANSKFGPLTLSTVMKTSSLLGARDGTVGCATDKKLPHVNALRSNLADIINDMKKPLGWE